MSAPSNEVLSERLESDRRATHAYRKELKLQLDRIEEQALRTNGRVRALEVWRTFLLGAFTALSLPAAGKIVALLHP